LARFAEVGRAVPVLGEAKGRIFDEHYEGAEEGIPHVAVDVAVSRFMADGLPAERSTLYDWANQGKIDAV
jgi:hypothetical protein